MKNIFLIFFLFISSSSFSQTIHARVLSAFTIEILADTLKIDSSKNILKTANPRVNITEGQIEIIDGDTTVVYFKGIPKLSEDDELFYRYWEDAINENGLECVVLLSHYKEG
jgi:lipopolysaccharide export system protein LptA